MLYIQIGNTLNNIMEHVFFNKRSDIYKKKNIVLDPISCRHYKKNFNI